MRKVKIYVCGIKEFRTKEEAEGYRQYLIDRYFRVEPIYERWVPEYYLSDME